MSYATGNSEDRQAVPITGTPVANGPGSLLSIGLSSSLSVISPLTKDSASGQASGLRHRINQGSLIEKHLLRAEEHRKISKGFNISSRNAVKRWFVLYDDSHKPIGGGGESKTQIPSNLPQPATYHDIVIDTVSGSPASTTIDPPYYIPAHLEYHDNEKKWRAGGNPNKDIILKDCFNICRKLDGAGIKDHVIAVVSIKDTLDIIFEKEQDMLIWLELLLSCQQGGRSAQGRIAKPIYENMWEVNVKGFKSDKGSSSKFFQMTGPHRLVATEDAFKFFELGSDEPIPFAYKDIKGHKNHNRNYIIQTGRMTRSGRGEIEIDCKDHHVSAQIYATFERFTKETIPDKQGKTSSGHHGHFHGRMNSTSSSRSSRSRDSMQGHGNVLHHGSSAVTAPRGEYRPRSESWSNPTIPHSLTDSKHGVLPGYPGKTDSSNQGSGVEEKPSAPNATTYSDIAAGKQSILANMVSKKDPRFRTTSEGNHFGKIFPIKSSGGAKYSITSGSPMSPGSYMSSESNAESAGSSNSIDDTEIPYGPSMTPNADHAQEATIFEESSAESWVDPSDPKSIEEHIMKEEEIKDAKKKTPNHHHLMNRQIGTSSLIGRVGEDMSPFHYSMTNHTSNVGLGKFTGNSESSSDIKRASSLHANISHAANKIDEVVDAADSDASTISYAQLSLEKYNDAPGQVGNKAIATNDFLPGSHPALIGVPIPRCQNSFKRGVMGGEPHFGLASSPSQTHYATILNANDMSSTNIPTAPMYLVTSTSKTTDLTIATSPLGRGGGSSDYMLMSPPPSLATPPVPNSVNYALSVTPNSNNNANNNNLSSVATNCSGSSSSTSSLKRQQSLGNGSNCGARSNISTLERERRRLSMLGLDEDRITSMLMTSSLTGSVSNPRDPSSSLITSPSSQSSYNPLSDGGCLDKEDLTAGGDEDASVYTLMSPTGGASTTSQVPIPGASSPNSTSTARQISHSFNPSKTHSISSLNRRYSGRRSVGNNYKDVIPSESAVSNQPSNIDFKQCDDSESSNYVHMCPPSSTVSATSFVPPNVRSCDTEKDNLPAGNMSSYHGSEHNRSGRLTEDQVPNMAHPYRAIEESSSSTTGSRRGSKSSLSHLGSSPSAALTSHLAGPVLPLYTDLGNCSTTNFDQSSDVSPYLLMSPVESTDEKLLLRDECDNPTSQTLSAAALKGSSNISMHPVVRTRHRNRMSNSGSKRSSMCSDGGTGNIPISSPNLVGSVEANKNVETAEWLSNTFSGSSVGCKSGGSRNSSLVGTPIGSLPTSSSLHHYKDAVDGVGAETYLSKQRSSHKDNILPEYSDDVYVPLNFGDDDATVGSHDMPLQDHEITLSQRRSTSTASGNIQIPARQGQARNALPRMSPASSGSLISGATPSSFKGMDAFPSQASGFSECNIEERETPNKEDKKDRSQNCDGPKSSIIHGRAFSMSSTNRPSTVSSSNSSIGSSMGQGSKQNTAKVQGQVTKDKTNAVSATQAGTSPNTMAARLGSWFRTRAGSVPARPSMDGKRRHRTQSEGEKNFEPSISLPENEQT
jgi:hypothetical protein